MKKYFLSLLLLTIVTGLIAVLRVSMASTGYNYRYAAQLSGNSQTRHRDLVVRNLKVLNQLAVGANTLSFGSDYIYSDASKMRFLVSNPNESPSEKMVIKNDGNVGIGTTSPLGDAGDLTLGNASGTVGMLYIYGTGNHYARLTTANNGNLHIDPSFDNSAIGGLYLNYFTGGKGVFFGNANRTAIGVWKTDSKVGMGTLDPKNNLEIKDSSSEVVSLGITGKVNAGEVATATDGVSIKSKSTNAANHGISFFTPNASGTLTLRAIIREGDGNVGIGTGSPSRKLEVVGDSKTSGNVEVGKEFWFAGHKFKDVCSVTNASGTTNFLLSETGKC